MQRKINNLFAIVLFISILFWSCDSKVVYDSYKTLPNSWHKDSIIKFAFNSPDTIKAYNLYINLRTNNDYKYSNLFLLTELGYPNGKTVIDTLEYKMAKPSGELLGTGFADVKENKLWYKGYKNTFKFTELGTHHFKVKHAMRNNGDVNGILELEGITDVGFRIENN